MDTGGIHGLDLGCGYGVLGLNMAKSAPDGHTLMVDKDFVAVDYAEKNYAKYFEAPTEWQDIGLSSLEHYAEEQQPAPVKGS